MFGRGGYPIAELSGMASASRVHERLDAIQSEQDAEEES